MTGARLLCRHKVDLKTDLIEDLYNNKFLTAEQMFTLMSLNPPKRFTRDPLGGKAQRAFQKACEGALDFGMGSGPIRFGQVAFSVEDALRMKEDGDTILVLKDYSDAVLDALDQGVKGIVIFQPSDLCGHVKMAAQVNDASCLLLAQDPSGYDAFRSSVSTGDVMTMVPRSGAGKLLRGLVQIDEDVHFRGLDSTAYLCRRAAQALTRPAMSFYATIDGFPQCETLSRVQGFQTGVGLMRTEHMALFSPPVRKALDALMCGDGDQAAALEVFGKGQQDRLDNIFLAMGTAFRRLAQGPVTIPVHVRLLDALPNEFLLPDRLKFLRSVLPEDQWRGAQMGLARPELYKRQIAALFASAAPFITGVEGCAQFDLHVVVPNVKSVNDIFVVKNMLAEQADGIPYRFDMMGETEEALRDMRDLAPHIDGLSFGSNDLTQTILGVPRGDIGVRLAYSDPETGLKGDPYRTVHPEVARRMIDAAALARSVNPSIRIGLCGEHAADLRSLQVLTPAHLDWVSVPPSRRNLLALPTDWLLRGGWRQARVTAG